MPGPNAQHALVCTKTLLSLKQAKLRSVAASLGVSISGTKPQLASRILELVKAKDEQPQSPTEQITTLDRPRRILSIDMGIRNLAFCLIEVPPAAAAAFSSVGQKEAVRELSKPSMPKVLAWKVLQVVPRPEDAEQRNPKNNGESSTTEAGEGQPHKEKTSELEARDSQPPAKEKKRIKESFEPTMWAIHANTLSRRLLNEYSPDTILIERQRYRSHGAASILEWTVRVNMFESMLHAVLRCLLEQGVWGGSLISISPKKVYSFWSAQAMEAMSEGVERKRVRRKKAEILKVQPVEFTADVVEKRGRGRPRKEERASLKEGDMENYHGNSLEVQPVEFAADVAEKRGRGRTRKDKQASLKEGDMENYHGNSLEVQPAEFTADVAEKRGRGRPRKEKQALPKEEEDIENYHGNDNVRKEILDQKTTSMTSSYRRGKIAKSNLVTSWLRRGDVISLDGPGATETASHFIPPEIPGRRRVSKDKLKLDDLADCLLQGIAWMRWEENRKNLYLESLTEK
ncbi:hypothetical protein RUND412_003077 [Rhizina undulata]